MAIKYCYSLIDQTKRPIVTGFTSFPERRGRQQTNCVNKLLTFQRDIGSQISLSELFFWFQIWCYLVTLALDIRCMLGMLTFPFTAPCDTPGDGQIVQTHNLYKVTISTSRKEFSSVWKWEHFGTAFFMCWQQALTFDCTFVKWKSRSRPRNDNWLKESLLSLTG